MKKSRFTDSQIMAALKRVEVGLPVPEICRELRISPARMAELTGGQWVDACQ